MNRVVLLSVALLALCGVWFWARQSRLVRQRARYAHYTRRRSVLLPHERSLYETLQAVAGTRMRILAKVRLGDVVTVEGETQSPQRQAHWRSAQRRGVDLLLCDADDYAPILAVQVEAKKERARRRTRGDTILEDVLSSAGIRLLALDPADIADAAHLDIRLRTALESARISLTEAGPTGDEDTPETTRTGLTGLLDRLLGVFTADVQDLLRRLSEPWGMARSGIVRGGR